MKNFKKINKKIFAISLFFSLLAVLTVWLYYLGSQEKDVKISVKKGNAYITYVKINKTNYLLNKFANQYNLEYIDDKVLIKPGDVISIRASRITNIQLNFEEINDESTLILVENGSELIKKEINSKTKENQIMTNHQLRTELSNFFQESIILKTIISIILLNFFIVLFYKMFFYILKIIQRNESSKKFSIKELFIFFIIILVTLCLSLYSLLSIMNIYMIVVYFLIIILFAYKTYKYLSKNLANFFFVLGSIFGVTMILLLPPFHVPDEAAHYFKAYSIFASKDVFTNNSKKYIGLSESVAQQIDMYNMDLLGYDYKVSTKDYFSDKLFFSKDSNKKHAYYFDNTAHLNSFCYIPSAIIIAVSEVIGLPFIISYRLAKILNLIIFLFAIFHCLNILPKFKKIFFMVSLFPITLQQAGGICQDSLTMVLCFLFITYIIKGIYSKSKLSLSDKIKMIIIPILLGFCKIGYFPITFMVLLIKNDKFKTNKEAILFKSLFIIPCLILSGIQYISAGTSVSETNFYPIGMIFTHPITIAKVCIKTLLNRFHFDLLTGLVDGFGWSTIWNYKLITYVSSLIYLIFLVVNGENSKKVPINHRILFFFCSFIMIAFIYASLLFAWTPIGNSEIDGLQCRYFIIPALLFYITISNSKFSLKLKNQEYWMGFGVSIVLVACFFSILVGFYL